MEGLIMAAQLLLGLSILVGLHELGHLLAAKAFGMRVEKYSIGFPPKIWGKKFGETEYSIGAIPLGGFVKISGMIDESLDTKSMNEEPEPWEFRAKPAWQRLIVMMGGIIVNVITGIVIFIALLYINGESYITKAELNKHGIEANNLARQIGLQTGDRIVDISGQDYETFSDLFSPDVILGSNVYYTVLRDGEYLKVDIPSDFLDKLSDKRGERFMDYRAPFEVGQVLAGSNAADGGLQPGDKFITVNGDSIFYYDEFKDKMEALRGQEFTALVTRPMDGAENQMTAPQQLTLKVDEDGLLGFQAHKIIDYSTRQFGLGVSVVKGTNEAFGIVWQNIRGFGLIFSGQVSASKSLSGPIGIAQFFGGTWDWNHFWRITGLLSMVLAFMNFLPIPALDGGHVAFLTWEIVSGRKPSDRFLENAQKVGMVLLLGLMSYAIFNDVYKLLPF
ncbi:MAG: RIP metalloprotease RseP [Cyclobacteriaceae bacterium]